MSVHNAAVRQPGESAQSSPSLSLSLAHSLSFPVSLSVGALQLLCTHTFDYGMLGICCRSYTLSRH